MSDEGSRVGVIVTRHAVERLMQRADGGGNATRDYAGWIFREVQHALRAGRLSKRRPRWATYLGRRRGLNIWHCWDEDEQRCYVLTKRNQGKQISRSGEFRRSWVVMSVITREHTDRLHHRGDEIRAKQK